MSNSVDIPPLPYAKPAKAWPVFTSRSAKILSGLEKKVPSASGKNSLPNFR
jgi:hypothetical protein